MLPVDDHRFLFTCTQTAEQSINACDARAPTQCHVTGIRYTRDPTDLVYENDCLEVTDELLA